MADDDGKRTAVTAQDIVAIRSWLSPTEFDSVGSEYHKHLKAHAAETGGWVFQTEAYRKWHDENMTGGLWIQGIPGSGKSVLAAQLIETLKRKAAPVAFFFARRTIKVNSDAHALVRDCLFQLLDSNVYIVARLKHLRQQHPNIDDAPFHELWSAFCTMLSLLPRVYVVLDALDELHVEEHQFLTHLLALTQQKPGSIKVIMTGRPVAPLLDALKGPSLGLVRLTERAVGTDVATYIAQRLSQQHPALSEGDRSRVHDTLCQKAKGLFLYARLVLDQLLERPSTPMTAHLHQLPSSLEDMYLDLLHEHATCSGAGIRFQTLILSWITYASRPLRVSELAALVTSAADCSGLDKASEAKRMVRTACGPLLEILDDDTVQVVHHSFTEFLVDGSRPSARRCDRWFPAFAAGPTHHSLAMSCIDYLGTGCFAEWNSESGSSSATDEEEDYHDFWKRRRGKLLVKHPFLQYAALNLLYHATRSHDGDLDLVLALDRFFRHGSHDYESWKDFWFTARSEYIIREFRPLHVAAWAGLTKYAVHLLQQGQDPNTVDSKGRTPIAYAAIAGQAETLEALLRHQATFTREDCDGLAPVHHAAKGNHVQALQCLLDAGGDALHPQYHGNTVSQSYRDPLAVGKTPLAYACEMGNVDATSVLLRHLGPELRNLVLPHCAVVSGQAATLRILLEYPEIRANINKTDPHGTTALYLAACTRDPATVRLLLHHGADVHALSAGSRKRWSTGVPAGPQAATSQLWTPLQGWAGPASTTLSAHYQTAVEQWEEAAELLIEAGADLETRDHNGKTILFYWCQRFDHPPFTNERIVSFLLRHGVNVRATDHNGDTSLHVSAVTHRPGPNSTIQLLVDAGADINEGRDGDGMTPLMVAAQNSRFNIELFVENGADPNMQDSNGNTALHYVCKSWIPGLSVLERWLMFADPTIRNRLGQTCLYNLRFGNHGHERVQAIPLFVERGLNLESRDRSGRTALLAACQNAEQHFIIGLLENGADATTTDFEGKSCLHVLARTSLSTIDNGPRDRDVLLKVMMQLIDRGADINATDCHGNTPFHDAITDSRFSRLRVEAIVQLGGLANLADNHGHTALHKVALRPNIDSIKPLQYLLESDFGLDLHALDYQGLMPIHCAASASEVSLWTLVQAGADIQARTEDGRNVLHLAAAAAQSSSLGLLCPTYRDNSWDVDARDEDGRSPLHYAVASRSSECVFHLLQAGANPNAQEHRGMTPLHLAAQRKVNVVDPGLKHRDLKFPYTPMKRYDIERMRPLMDLGHQSPTYMPGENLGATVGHDKEVQMIEDIIRLLITGGADPDIRDSSGYSAYDLSVVVSHESAARILQTVSKQGGREQALLERWCLVRANCANQIVQGLTIDDTNASNLLLTAICQRDEALLEALLAAGADPTLPGPDAITPVHYAAFWGLVSPVKTMARYISNWNGFRPPLLQAAASREHSNIQMVHLLVAHGVDVNARFAPYPGEHDSNSKHSISPAAYTAAHMLATGQRWWHIPALDAICKAAADLEATDSKGRTVLQCVLAERKAFWQNETLDVVLGHGANINFRSPKDGSTALLDALRSRQSPKIIERLLHFGADLNAGRVPAIIVAVESQDVKFLKAVLDAGADPNTLYRPDPPRYSHDGPRVETPLMAAALADTYGWPESHSSAKVPLVSLLLERGADPLLVLPSEGATAGAWTTLFHEICYYHGLVSPILSTPDINLNLDTVNSDGVTPLLIACRLFKERGSTHGDSTPRHLILAGANIHAVDANGSTPLHLAVRSGLRSTVTLLLERGASVSATDNAGFTPLHYALGFGSDWETAVVRLSLIKILIEAGADPTLVAGPNGASALHLLAPLLVHFSPAGTCEENYNFQTTTDYLAEYKALYDLFINRGCDREGRDNDGATPIFRYVQEVKIEDEEIDNVPPAEDDILLMLDSHNVFATNNHGDTLLHVVAGRPDTERSERDAAWLFKELMDRGLNARRENNNGLTALDVAAALDKDMILQLFAREE
ncbi:hypothetical protein BDW75DRAFT_250178 [Aspergillus navahoensis]